MRKKVRLSYSVVIPVYNEEPNIFPLYEKLKPILKKMGEHEIIFVDDGSTDRTFSKLLELSEKDARLRIIKLRRNFGQSAALSAGFDHAAGKIVITMDGDLQNDPEDIPKLVKEIVKGYDIVCGWRKNRKDPFLRKKIPSRLFNWVASKLFGFSLHDLGCTLRAYRSEILSSIVPYGEMHRYIPVLAAWKGYKVCEVEVKHYSRKLGKTKYGFSRLLKGSLDLATIYFLEKFLSRPMHVFGVIGVLSIFFGFILGIYLVVLRFFFGAPLADRPALLLAVFLVIFGIQFTSLGLVCEMLTKYQVETEKKRFYEIEET